MIFTKVKNKMLTNHRLLNKTALIGVSIAVPSIRIAVIKPKSPAAPLLAVKFLPTIIKPLASAKSAIHHIENQTKVKKLSK